MIYKHSLVVICKHSNYFEQCMCNVCMKIIKNCVREEEEEVKLLMMIIINIVALYNLFIKYFASDASSTQQSHYIHTYVHHYENSTTIKLLLEILQFTFRNTLTELLHSF